MDIKTLLRESRAEDLLQPLGFQTETGKEQFKHQLRKFSSNIGILQQRQRAIHALQKSIHSDTHRHIEDLFQRIKKVEPETAVFFSHSDVEKNSYDQLLFSGWPSLQVLNTIPFLLLCVSFFKQYIVPALAVFTPLFMIVMPFLLLKYWYSVPLTLPQYIDILLKTFGLQDLQLKNPRMALQAGLTVFSIGQSIYQPIQNALHLQVIHGDMIQKANSLEEFLSCVEDLLNSIPSFQSAKRCLPESIKGDPHRLFAYYWDNPNHLKIVLQYVGDAEVLYRLAFSKELVPVQFVTGEKPFLSIKDGYDPLLKNPIPYTLQLVGSQHHAILTGPNRGGKSSVLRSTLLNVVLAQTFGFAFAKESFLLRPFDWVATGLRLEDRPGSQSMFESEVEFAIQILKRAEKQSHLVGFVLFDELFHSTNPPDGARTADIFLRKLWERVNVASFISTHVFDLAKHASKRCQRLCVPAVQDKDGSVQFTYTLKQGICRVSSVDLILKEKGLLSA